MRLVGRRDADVVARPGVTAVLCSATARVCISTRPQLVRSGMVVVTGRLHCVEASSRGTPRSRDGRGWRDRRRDRPGPVVTRRYRCGCGPSGTSFFAQLGALDGVVPVAIDLSRPVLSLRLSCSRWTALMGWCIARRLLRSRGSMAPCVPLAGNAHGERGGGRRADARPAASPSNRSWLRRSGERRAGRARRSRWSAYCASKAALRELADCLRREESAHGVKVASVYPSGTRHQPASDSTGTLRPAIRSCAMSSARRRGAGGSSTFLKWLTAHCLPR